MYKILKYFNITEAEPSITFHLLFTNVVLSALIVNDPTLQANHPERRAFICLSLVVVELLSYAHC